MTTAQLVPPVEGRASVASTRLACVSSLLVSTSESIASIARGGWVGLIILAALGLAWACGGAALLLERRPGP